MKGNCKDCPAYENCPRMSGASFCLSSHPDEPEEEKSDSVKPDSLSPEDADSHKK